MKKLIITVITALTVLISLSSCEEESKIFEVRAVNQCYMDILNTGVPFLKVSIDEVILNDEVVATSIAAPIGDGSSYRTSSDYFSIETGIDYEVKIKYTTYYYDVDELMWETNGSTDTYVAGTESWSADDDHSTFALKFTCGTLLNGYRPVFDTFYEE